MEQNRRTDAFTSMCILLARQNAAIEAFADVAMKHMANGNIEKENELGEFYTNCYVERLKEAMDSIGTFDPSQKPEADEF